MTLATPRVQLNIPILLKSTPFNLSNKTLQSTCHSVSFKSQVKTPILLSDYLSSTPTSKKLEKIRSILQPLHKGSALDDIYFSPR